MFRRRRKSETADVEDQTPAEVEVPADDTDEAPAPAPPPRPQGPWDVEDAPPDPEGAQRLDLGGMRVPVVPGLELRIDVDAEQKPVAATVVAGPSAMQVNAFAAPRSEGIWGEVRTEILVSLQPGGAREVEGPFGPEVLSKVPAGPPVPGRGVPVIDARFIGIDGPRWFLRGLISGPAATDRALAEPFEQVLRGTIVVRGGDAMAPRQPLPLTLPRQVQEAAAQQQAAQAQQQAQQQALAAAQAQQRAIAAAQARIAAQQPGAQQPGAQQPGAQQPGAGGRTMADQLAAAARAVAARQSGESGSATPAPVTPPAAGTPPSAETPPDAEAGPAPEAAPAPVAAPDEHGSGPDPRPAP